MLNMVVLFWWSSTDRLLPGEVNIDWLCSNELLLLLLLLLINVSRHRVRLRSTYSLLWYGPPSDFTTADTDNGFILLQMAVGKCKYTWSLVIWYCFRKTVRWGYTSKFQRLSDILYEADNELHKDKHTSTWHYSLQLYTSAPAVSKLLKLYQGSFFEFVHHLFSCSFANYVTCLVVFPQFVTKSASWSVVELRGGPRGPGPLKDHVAPRNTWFERVQGGL